MVADVVRHPLILRNCITRAILRILFLLAARQRVQALSALAPQRRLKLVADRESAVY